MKARIRIRAEDIKFSSYLVLLPPANNHLLRVFMALPGLNSKRMAAPGSFGVFEANRTMALASSVRMVDRVHGFA